MDMISDRNRRVSVDELNTSQLLAHARKAKATTLRDFAEYARAYDAGAFKPK